MNPTIVGIVVFTFTFGGALFGIRLREILPESHLSAESKDTVKVGIGLIATMTALILGLVTASAKSSFDELNGLIKHAAADVISLDRVLGSYGPEASTAREALKAGLAHRVELTWPRDSSKKAELGSSTANTQLEKFTAEIRGLAPQNEDQKWLKGRAIEQSQALSETRWRVFSGLGSSVPVPFLAILIFWLTITFISFGMFAPRNATVVTVLFMCSLSVAGAVFLVLEMDGPFSGLIRVPADPLLYALSLMNQ